VKSKKIREILPVADRQFCPGFARVIRALMLAAMSARISAQADLPNIILIIGDDISPDFSCFGGDAYTPNIDRLAAGGIRFENAYVTASSCSPSRCSIITGRYPHNTGAPELHMDLPKGQFMFPQALKESGYHCVLYGKNHMGEYVKQAFNEFYEIPYAEDPTGAARWVQCLQERPKDQPFFMWFAAYDAHRPWEADPGGVPVDPMKIRLPAGVPDTPAAREDMAAYLVEVQRFDRYIGNTVDELKKQGVFENTLLIVLGDNGRPFPRSKTTLYDDGMKTPLVIHWPAGQIVAGAVSSSLISTIDLAPAVLEAAGLPVPPQVQGLSLLPACRNPELKIRETIFGERNWHVQRACARMLRQGDYLYIRDFSPQFYSFQMVDHKDGAYAELLRLKAEGKLTPEQAEEFSTRRPPEHLFNVATDPNQLHNLAGNPENKALLEFFRRTLSDWQVRTGDSIPEAREMTPDRLDRTTYEQLYSGRRPPGGIVPGQQAGATEINDRGPR